MLESHGLSEDTLIPSPFSGDGQRECDPSPVEQRFLNQKPVLFLASNLFPALHLRRHGTVRQLPLTVLSSSKRVAYSGERLDQADLDVFVLLLAKAREAGIKPGQAYRVPAHPLLTELGRRSGKQGRAWLKNCLFRLEAGRLVIRDARFSFATKLVSKFLYDHQEHEAVVVLDRDLQRAFPLDRLPILVRERAVLRGDAVAKWLHAMSWALGEPFRVTTDVLFDLSGLPEEQRSDFPATLESAIATLADQGMLRWQRQGSGTFVLSHTANAEAAVCCRVLT